MSIFDLFKYRYAYGTELLPKNTCYKTISALFLSYKTRSKLKQNRVREKDVDLNFIRCSTVLSTRLVSRS